MVPNPNRKMAGLMARIDRWMRCLLKGTHAHYACFWPAPPGLLVGLLMRLFYRGITLAPKQADVFRHLPRHAIRVYVNKRKSRFEWLFYHTRYGDSRLPVPTIGFDYAIFLLQPLARLLRMGLARLDLFVRRHRFQDAYASGYYRDMLLQGEVAFLSLMEPGGFYRRFVKQRVDPIRFLLEMQQSSPQPIFLIPHLMVYKKEPDKANPSLWGHLFGPEKPFGRLWRLATMIKKPGRIFVEISAPLDLQTFLAHPQVRDRGLDYQTLLLRRNLLLQINRHRQSIMGPVLKSRLEIKESVLTGPSLQSFIQDQAASENQPVTKLHKQADAYFDEIAADYRMSVIKTFEAVLTWIINTMFDGFIVDHEGLDRLKAASRQGPLILLPCHKSHIDYLMLSYVMYHHNMPCPHIVAGKNLSFWPMGPIFRRSGAFFMRRTFKGQPLYARVFSTYVAKLLQEGFNIEVFIEGGRSRTGKLLSPKIGFLSILLEAYENGACEDLILAPLFIGYDKVPEEKAYLHELEGGKKEPESLLQVIRARKLLKKRFGKIYIAFHEPISLAQLLRSNGLDLKVMSAEEKSALGRNIGHRAINAINRVAVITPHALMAAAVLNHPAPSFDREALMEVADTYLTHLHFHEIHLADTLILEPRHALNQAFEIYLQRKFVEPLDKKAEKDEDAIRFRPNSEKRPSLDYYKNNCVACFVTAAYTALAIFERDAFQFAAPDLHAGYRFLQDLFKYEFAYDIDKTVEWYIRKNLKAFIDDAILIPHPTLPDSYNVTSAGFRKLKLFANFLRPYFESYWVVLSQLESQSEGSLAFKEQMKKIEARGARMLKTAEIERTEALSQINFKNALTFFQSRNIRCQADEAALASYRASLQRYLERLQ